MTTLSAASVARNGRRSSRPNGRRYQRRSSNDDSRADLLLCNILAFWTRDKEQIARIVSGSALNRDKWDRPDYRDRTIEKALATVTETYSPRVRVVIGRMGTGTDGELYAANGTPRRRPRPESGRRIPDRSRQRPPDLVRDHGHDLRHCHPAEMDHLGRLAVEVDDTGE